MSRRKIINLRVTEEQFYQITDALYDQDHNTRELADTALKYITKPRRKKAYDDAWKCVQLRTWLFEQRNKQEKT